ncbi:MAG TPA: xanthine dehydrogenase family protein subunit M [Acidimicrobiales bacterium]|jgi:carbon-monoxide dehydrogenase medium subunit|nr:xanthine dehydrogenase family protein subunit M [Acidimicrobiales bacterium]
MAVTQYLQPTTLEGALGALGDLGEEARPLAGGQSLMVLLHEGLVAPTTLVGLSRVAGLADIGAADGGLRIGAMATHSQVLAHPEIRARWPLLAAAEEAVSTVQIRNQGTLCGNLAHAYPSADPPAALMALDAVVEVASASGARQVAVEDLFTGPLTTVLDPGELITAVRLPAPPPGDRSAYRKYALRPLDFPIVGAAVRVVIDGGGTCRQVRIAVNGGSNRPIRLSTAEAEVEGAVASRQVVAAASDAASSEADPLEEVFESAAYRRRMVGVYVGRALADALGVG